MINRSVVDRYASLPAVAVVGGLSLLSLIGLVRRSFRPDAVIGGRIGTGAWQRVLADPDFVAAFWFTLRSAVVATVVSLVIAVPLGLAVRRRGWLVRALVAAPVPVPHLVVASVAVSWLAAGGLVDRLVGQLPVIGDRFGLGVVVVYVFKEVPFLVLLVVAALDDRTARLEEAAASLGAGRAARWRFVVVPRLRVPLVVGGLVVAAFVVGSTEVPLVVGPVRPDSLTTYSLTVVKLRGPVARADAAAALVASSALVVALTVVVLAVARRADRRIVRGAGRRVAGRT